MNDPRNKTAALRTGWYQLPYLACYRHSAQTAEGILLLLDVAYAGKLLPVSLLVLQ